MSTTLLAEPAGTDLRQAARPSRVALALAGLTLVALLLRVLFAGRSGLWRDEALFLWVVRVPTLSGMLAFLAGHESHPPLFYLLMRGWLRLFGDSERAALALPVLLGVAQVPLAYAVGADLFSRSTGLIAAALVATSPTLASYSAQVRPYSLLPLLCLASVYFLGRGLEGGRWWNWLVQGLATLAMLLTHNWSWLVLAAEGAFVGVFALSRGLRQAAAPALTWSAVLACYAPWVPSLLGQCRHAGHDGAGVPWLPAVFVFAESTTTLAGPFALPLLLFLIVVVVLAARDGAAERPGTVKGPWALLLLVLIPAFTFMLSVALSSRTFLVLPRCQLMTAPCFILAASFGAAALRHVKPHAVLAVAALFTLSDWSELGAFKSNAREVAAAVADRAQPTDLVVITPHWLASSFNYYYSREGPQVCYPFEGRVGAIWFDDLRARLADPGPMARARSRLKQAGREGRRVWLVTDRNGPPARFPAGDQLPSRVDLKTFTEVGDARADQLLDDLHKIYGAPVVELAPLCERRSSETLRALLFDPDGRPSR
jgi:4-amino-4-deoxy-L-arabinose transferase-like glycosyltransferase